MEGTGYRPELKCTWSDVIKLYKYSVLNARRDIQRAVLGKGPFSLNTQYQYLTITDTQWSGMSRQDRQKHLEMLGAAVEEEAEDEDANTTNTSVNNDHPKKMGVYEIMLLIHLLLPCVTSSCGTRNTGYLSIVLKRKPGLAKH